jgi:predicted  nucleic acid-binding Zn-ribbon protein
MGFAFKLELLKRLDKLDATMKLFIKSFVESNREVLSQLQTLTEKICDMSKVQEDLEQDIRDLNDATNSVADVLTSVRNQLKDGLSPAEANALKLELDAAIARTRSLAADPANPVPVAPPLIPPADTTAGTGGQDTPPGTGF